MSELESLAEGKLPEEAPATAGSAAEQAATGSGATTDESSRLAGEAGEKAADSSITDDPVSRILEVDISDYLPEFIQPGFQYLQEFPLLLAILLVAAGWSLGKLLTSLVNNLLGRIAAITQSNLDDHIVRHLEAPIIQTTVTLALVASVFTLQFPESISHVAVKTLLTLLVFFWGKAWFAATPVILAELEANREKFHVFQPRTVPLFEMGIKLFLLGILAYLVFIIWGIDATAWVASAGIIGIAVGFAAKDTLSNLISGVSIIADAPYKIGDYIVLDSGERGIVTSLGIRSTRLLTRDDVEISVPNSLIGGAKITNESGGPWVKQRIRVPVGVAYGSETEKVVEIMEAIANENDGVVDQPAPRVRMRGFGDSSLNFELLAWIGSPEQRGLVMHQLLMEIDQRFRQENIEIPFPQRDLHMRSVAEAGKAAQDSPGEDEPATADQESAG
ncbi:MAG TPA: mechanosensitive ion channel family protein [Xanthomonadales bacterium]|nr:mechanosensitive ion channel family protein [Xanthomonadales bacterium]